MSPVIAWNTCWWTRNRSRARPDPANLALVVFEADRLTANSAIHEELNAERVMDQLHEVASQLLVGPGPATDRTNLYVGMIRVRVLDFVMRARGHAKELASAVRVLSVTRSSFWTASAEW